jgi:hypothetical protein
MTNSLYNTYIYMYMYIHIYITYITYMHIFKTLGVLNGWYLFMTNSIRLQGKEEALWFFFSYVYLVVFLLNSTLIASVISVMNGHAKVCMYVCIYTYLCIYIYIHMYVCMHIYTYVCVYAYMYIYIYVYIYIYIYIYNYIYIHIYINICIYIYFFTGDDQ